MATRKLIQFSTNAADDSKGVAFGLSGNLFLYVVGGAVISMILVLLFSAFLRIPIFIAVVIGCIPFLTATLYAVLLVNNKPPHYQDDLLQHCLGLDYISFSERNKLHPFSRAQSTGKGD